MAEPIAPIDAKTKKQLATLERTYDIVEGIEFDVNPLFVFVGAVQGNHVAVSRAAFDELVLWYITADPANMRENEEADDG